jgi:hypothetical protein
VDVKEEQRMATSVGVGGVNGTLLCTQCMLLVNNYTPFPDAKIIPGLVCPR